MSSRSEEAISVVILRLKEHEKQLAEPPELFYNGGYERWGAKTRKALYAAIYAYGDARVVDEEIVAAEAGGGS